MNIYIWMAVGEDFWKLAYEMDGISTFFGVPPQKSLQGWIFHVQWTPSLDFDYVSCFRCIRYSYVDFHLFEWKKQSTNPAKKSNFCTPNLPKFCATVCFFLFFVHQKKTTGENAWCESVEKNNDGVSGRNWRILWMFIGGESSKVQLGEKMSDGKGELWVLEM